MKNQYLKNVATLKLMSDRGTGCGRCIEVCPHNVFVINKGISSIIDKNRCMECGACVKNCPFDALEVKPGVGCALAIIMGWLKGTEPNCDCSGNGSGGCC